MNTYVRRAETVQAFQMTTAAFQRNSPLWPTWLLAAWNKPVRSVGSFYYLASRDRYYIETSETPLEVAVGDWIVLEYGTMYVMQGPEFEAVFERRLPTP